MRTLFSFTHTSHTRFFDQGRAVTQTYSCWPFFCMRLQWGPRSDRVYRITPSSARKGGCPAFVARTKHGTHIGHVHQHVSHGRFQDAIKMETEEGRRSVVGEELSNSESCLYFSTVMYWLGPTFLLNDFGKPFKKHIKDLCSAWAQLLLCFFPRLLISLHSVQLKGRLSGVVGESDTGFKHNDRQFRKQCREEHSTNTVEYIRCTREFQI